MLGVRSWRYASSGLLPIWKGNPQLANARYPLCTIQVHISTLSLWVQTHSRHSSEPEMSRWILLRDLPQPCRPSGHRLLFDVEVLLYLDGRGYTLALGFRNRPCIQHLYILSFLWRLTSNLLSTPRLTMSNAGLSSFPLRSPSKSPCSSFS